MDSEVSVMLHCAPGQGFEEHQVQAEISGRFNRRRVPDIEEHIEAVWNERVTKEPWLFNGAKFRLHSAELSTSPPTNLCPTSGRTAFQSLTSKTAEADGPPGNQLYPAANRMFLHCGEGDHVSVTEMHTRCCCRETGGEPQNDSILRLQLGLTCYKDFLGTNWSQEAANLQQRGRLDSGDPQALLAQPLGVGAVLLTSDGQVVMLKRSQKVAEAAGLLDIPGGHPEPKAVCRGVSEEDISVDLMQGCERAVVAEIFSSVCAEVRDEDLYQEAKIKTRLKGYHFSTGKNIHRAATETLNTLDRDSEHSEVNVPLGFLSSPVLMGIALNHTSAGRPSAEFFIRCSLTTEAVKDFYRRGGPEAHESTDIVFLSKSEMLQLDATSPLWSKLCPSAKGAVLLYQLVRPDAS